MSYYGYILKRGNWGHESFFITFQTEKLQQTKPCCGINSTRKPLPGAEELQKLCKIFQGKVSSLSEWPVLSFICSTVVVQHIENA